MRTLEVNTSRPYEIKIASGLLPRAGQLCRQALPRAKKLAVEIGRASCRERV